MQPTNPTLQGMVRTYEGGTNLKRCLRSAGFLTRNSLDF